MTAIDTTDARSASQAQPGALSPAYWQALSASDLLEHCRRGEPAAFGDLMRRYERPVYRLAYHLAGNHDDANEIASETFVRIHRAIGTIRSAVTLSAWINRIVTNIHRDMRRRASRRPAISLEDLPEAAQDAVLSAEGHGSVSPYEYVEAAERKRILDDAIASLPDHHRELVALFHRAERTYDEIALTMRLPVGTVKSRLHRARLSLRKSLAPARAAFVD